jgi:hypothetical protein
MRRARGQLKGPVAVAGLACLAVLAACGHPAVSAASAQGSPSAAASAPPPPAPALSQGATRPVTEATCATAPLGVRVVAVRRESADSVRVELALANLAPADAWKPGSAAVASVRAATEALEGLSILSADGRRRLFPLRGSTGRRVGSAVTAPGPGKPETFWTVFPAADGPISLLLPGFAPLSGLPVAGQPDRPEP